MVGITHLRHFYVVLEESSMNPRANDIFPNFHSAPLSRLLRREFTKEQQRFLEILVAGYTRMQLDST